MEAPFDPRDALERERLAEQAYLRERAEEAAADQEHHVGEDVQYLALSWDCLSDWAKRPYRTAVAVVCDSLAA